MTVLTSSLVDYSFHPADTWRSLAACKGMDTDMFYPEGRGEVLHRREEIAKQICAGCAVARQCREAANERPERFWHLGWTNRG